MTELYQHRARKRFGQNFLHDAGVIHRILRAIHGRPSERLLEIGPGQGALTEGLLGSGARLDVIELDQDLIPLLRLKFGLNPLFTLHQGDAMKYDLSSIAAGDRLRVVGNLPYNISTPLIFHLLSFADIIADMHFMLQKEVVERLAAVPGNGDWGRLSIMAQCACRGAFGQRRKTLRNTLKGTLDSAAIEAADVDPGLRPEQLDLAAYVRLANQLASS